ncbi:MAG: hypothetical protein AAFP98_09470 [Pseudomonadota bacterium]
MAVSTDMFRSWRRPKDVMRELLAQGQREDRLVAFIMGACFLMYIAQWPWLMRVQQFGLWDEVTTSDFQTNAGTSFFSLMILAPLMFYALAALTQVVAKAFKARLSPYGARLALFWALLATAPVVLLHGLTKGFIGVGPAASLVGAAWFALFLWVWSQCFWVAEREGA